MLKKLVLATAVALPLAMAGLSGSAMAYATKYWIPLYPNQPAHSATAQPMHRSAMSCNAAGRMLRANGFHNVRTVGCGGGGYTFHAVRNGHPVMLHVNPRTGQIMRGA